MIESRAYITEQIWFDCKNCGKQITHHTVHTCFVMNPDILPTMEEWKLICKMVKQQRELTDEEIKEEIEKMFGKIIDPEVLNDELTLARAILKKASKK